MLAVLTLAALACQCRALAPAARRAATDLRVANQLAHDALVARLADELTGGARALPASAVRRDAMLRELPAEWGLRGDALRGDARRRPDLVALDARRAELLVIEVTIVPDAALAKCAERKRRKYADLARARHGPLRPILGVVAVGAGGAVPAESRAAIQAIAGDGAERAVEAARAIAMSRPGRALATRRRRSPALHSASACVR